MSVLFKKKEYGAPLHVSSVTRTISRFSVVGGIYLLEDTHPGCRV